MKKNRVKKAVTKKKKKKIKRNAEIKNSAKHRRSADFGVSEEELIKKVQAGDESCFSPIVSKYSRVVFNHARSFLRSKEEAEDASQEIFVNIYKNINRFRGDSRLSTWIYRITVNVCKNKLKQLKRHNARIIDERETEDGAESDNLLKNIREKQEKEPDRMFLKKDMREIILKRIQALSEEQKNVIVLRDIDGLSYDEIAGILKLSVSAVKSKLFRARENLREMLEKDEIL